MIVEFCGLPGSGKTTVIRQLLQEHSHQFDRVQFQSRWSVLQAIPQFHLMNARQIVQAVAYAVAYSSSLRVLWGTFGVRFLKLLTAQTINHDSQKILIIDEGPHQNIYTYARTSHTKTWVETYLTLVPKPDVVIVLNIPSEQWEANLVQRAKTDPTSTMSGTKTQQVAMQHVNEIFTTLVKDNPQYMVVTSSKSAHDAVLSLI